MLLGFPIRQHVIAGGCTAACVAVQGALRRSELMHGATVGSIPLWGTFSDCEQGIVTVVRSSP